MENIPARPQRQKAVALKYNPMEPAPKVIAKGVGAVADRILQKGHENDIPIHQDAKLAEELARMEIGEYIPPELYDVVAQVLAFIMELDHNALKELRAYAQ